MKRYFIISYEFVTPPSDTPQDRGIGMVGIVTENIFPPRTSIQKHIRETDETIPDNIVVIAKMINEVNEKDYQNFFEY